MSARTTVINVRDKAAVAAAESAELLTYVGGFVRQGRGPGARTWRASSWQNPFRNRGLPPEESLRLYREHVLSTPALRAHLGELRGRVLGCWWHPAPCHAHVLAELVASLGAD